MQGVVKAVAVAVLSLAFAGGCSPALDWRTVSVGDDVAALLPCRVERRARDAVVLGASRVAMEQYACNARGMTFAVSRAGVPEDADANGLLAAWAAAAGQNVGGTPQVLGPRRVRTSGGPGVPPLEVGHAVVVGRLPDGSAVRHEWVAFAHRQSVYQASVLGVSLAPDAVDAFFDGLEVKR